jgi:hypothetical protein
MLFEQISNEYLAHYSNKIKKSSNDWLLEKQESYKGDAYLERMEESIVFLFESSWGFQQTIARFLYQGNPWTTDPQEFRSYYSAISMFYGNLYKDVCLRFVRYGGNVAIEKPDASLADLRNEFDIHPICTDVDLNKYEKLHKLRGTGDIPHYIDELEFCCKFYYAQVKICEAYLDIMLQIPDIGRCSANIPLNTILETVKERTQLQTSIFLGLAQWQIPDNL